MLPLADERALPRVEIGGEAAAERELVVRRQMVDPQHRPVAGPRADDPDVVLRGRLLHPGLERESRCCKRCRGPEGRRSHSCRRTRARLRSGRLPTSRRSPLLCVRCRMRQSRSCPEPSSNAYAATRPGAAPHAGAATARPSRQNTIATPKRISSVRSHALIWSPACRRSPQYAHCRSCRLRGQHASVQGVPSRPMRSCLTRRTSPRTLR